MLSVGTVIGFFDPAGFDQLQVRCLVGNSSPPGYQALTLDNLMVQLINRPPAPVIASNNFSINPTNHVSSLIVFDTLSVSQYRLIHTENLAAGVWNPVTPPLPAGWQSGGGTLAVHRSGRARKTAPLLSRRSAVSQFAKG